MLEVRPLGVIGNKMRKDRITQNSFPSVLPEWKRKSASRLNNLFTMAPQVSLKHLIRHINVEGQRGPKRGRKAMPVRWWCSPQHVVVNVLLQLPRVVVVTPMDIASLAKRTTLGRDLSGKRWCWMEDYLRRAYFVSVGSICLKVT